MRRRGLWQNRGGAAGRLSRCLRGAAGGFALPHHCAGRTALPDLSRASGGLSRQCGAAQPFCNAAQAKGSAQGCGHGAGGYSYRHAPRAFKRRKAAQSGPAHSGRRAALWRAPQGKAQGAEKERGRAHAHGHAHSAHLAALHVGHTRAVYYRDSPARP